MGHMPNSVERRSTGEPLKILRHLHRIKIVVPTCGKGPEECKDAILKMLHKYNDRAESGNCE